MEDLKISIRSIIVYELIMIIGSMIMSSFDITSDNKLAQLIGNSIIQLISSGYIVYIILNCIIKSDKYINKKDTYDILS